MPSIREQILARIAAALTAASPGGAGVYRSREVSLTRAQTPAIVVMPARVELTRQSDKLDKAHLDVHVEIFTRGDPWDQLADPVDVAAHRIMMTDSALWALASDVRRISVEFEGQEADATAGTMTVTYRCTYLTSAGDITLAG